MAKKAEILLKSHYTCFVHVKRVVVCCGYKVCNKSFFVREVMLRARDMSHEQLA